MEILINNKFVSEKEAQISILSDAVMYGYGVFETLRTYNQKKTLRLNDHIARLLNSAQKINLQIKYNSEEIQKMAILVIQNSEHELQRIKVLALPETLIVISSELKLDETIYNGVALKTVEHKRSLPHIKSTSYLDCILYYNNANKKGYYDALFIDEKKYVYECSRSNIFWIKNNKLFSRKNDVLPGIIRKIIMEITQIPFEYINANLSELLKAEEIFITNSIVGIVPIQNINNNIIPGQPGKNTIQLMQSFNDIILAGEITSI